MNGILDRWLGNVRWGELLSWPGLAGAIFYIVGTRYLKLSDAEAALLAAGAFGTGATHYLRNPKSLPWQESERGSEGGAGEDSGPPRALPAGPNGIDSLARTVGEIISASSAAADLMAGRQMGSAAADLMAGRQMGSAAVDLPEARRHPNATPERPFAGPTPAGYRDLSVEELPRIKETARPVVKPAPEPDGPIDGPAPDFS